MSELDNPPQKSRVRSLHLGRVYNLGNYENMRVEVMVDIGTEDDPAKVLRSVEAILRDLHAKHGVDSWNLRKAREVLAKPKKDLTKEEKEALPKHKELVARVEAAEKRRQAARDALSTLDYTSEHIDHKDKWDDGDDY